MNTFWLKIAGAAVAVVVAIVVVSMFTSGGPQEPAPPEKTFYDQAEQDKEKFLAEPKPLENQQEAPSPPQPAESQTQAAPAQPAVEPPKPAEPPKPTIAYCSVLSEEDQIEAERLLNVAAPGYSLGRLQVGYALMMQNCRQVLSKWPDSTYAYRAKVMIIEMPERHRERYKVTENELDLSTFAKPRPGTKPFVVEELN
jgi:type IV secretory pathway VirB10-like protein